MYKVEKFEVRDPDILLSIIENCPFATVSTVEDGVPFLNHLPITFERLADGPLKLMGHMSARNPQWRHIKAGSQMVVAFHGPHTYVNSSWYAENDVPTWNYVAVHAVGVAELVTDFTTLVSILKKTTDHMNRIYEDQWDFSLPPDLAKEADLMGAIIGFTLQPKKLVGKFKLSQNRSRVDQIRVAQALRLRDDEGSREIANWMTKLVE